MNYWKYLKIVGAVLVVAAVAAVGIGASSPSTQYRPSDAGTKFNF